MEKRHRLYSVFKQHKRNPAFVQGITDGLIENLPLFPSQYAYITSYADGQVKAHKGFDRCLGYTAAEVSLDLLTRGYHPDEADAVMEIIARNLEWSALFPSDPFSVIFTIDHRMRKANGKYIRVLRQTTMAEVDESGKMTSSFSLCTDISHLKMEGKISAKLTGPNTEVVNYDDVTDHIPESGIMRLSAREMDILALVAKGKTSGEIGDMLHISVNTVNTHRRNMLARTGFSNIPQVIAYVAGKGMI